MLLLEIIRFISYRLSTQLSHKMGSLHQYLFSDSSYLTHKVPYIKMSSRHSEILFRTFLKKIRLDMSYDPLPMAMIHMKCQSLFAQKAKQDINLSSASFLVSIPTVNSVSNLGPVVQS